jgi:predicted transposase/invertase (TIGR01784 family)
MREDARAEGLAEGRAEGRAQGLQEGLAKMQQEKLEIARKLKARGIPPDQIAEDTGLSSAEIAKL